MSRSRILVKQVARIASTGALILGATAANAQTTPKADRTTDAPIPIASARPDNSTGAAPTISSPSMIRAVPKVEGTPSPGLRVMLDGSASTGGRVWYRWLQTQGTPVEIEGANRVQAQFLVPPDATNLGFVLVVGNATGVDAKAVSIDTIDPESEADGKACKADAGDDQSARVGRRVVLNGVRSLPKGRLRYRWIQSGGPKVVLKTVEGPTASFVPSAPGTYQFTLIVATAAGELSEPSSVTINVGGTIRASADAPPMAIDELARVSLASIEGGTKYADDLSKAFDIVADGIDSFKTFSDAINETTRRLDAVVPRDKDRRAVWIEQFFSPLMIKVVAVMKTEGIDVSLPESQGKALSKDQKARLAEQFRYTAAGLRASKTLR